MVTGANGFVGSAIKDFLRSNGFPVRGAVRTIAKGNNTAIGDIAANTNWLPALENVDTVIHTAARVHVMNDNAVDALNEFRKVNVKGTINFARQASKSNVKRFIYVSSIKVNGESTMPGKPFSVDDDPEPVDPYGISKWESEVGLRKLAKNSAMEVVIIRPPLVYGLGVKGNFKSMIRLINKGIPLPLGAVHNKRSFVSIDNLVDFIVTCIDHPAAANQTFLVSDGEDLSTTDLLQRIGRALDRPAILFPVSTSLLAFLASLIGKQSITQRLCGSLQVDISKAQEMLGWVPPNSVDEGLHKAIESLIK